MEMENSRECCGRDIETCAKIVAIIGIVSSIFSFNILGIVIYALVYIGVQNRRPGYLLPAKIVLIIGVVCTIILLFVGIVLGIVVAVKKPDTTDTTTSSTPTLTPDPATQIHHLNAGFIVLYGVLLLLGIAYLFISLIIIHRARIHLLLNPGIPEFHRAFSLDEK